MRIVLFLILLLSGNFLLVTGLFLTRLAWRSDIEPFGRGSPILQILIHPGKFAAPERVRVIRVLNLFGMVFLCGATVVLVYEILCVMLR